MKTKYILYLLVMSAMLFTSCDSDEEEIYIEELVVQGEMYVGQPMRIRLEHTVPWNSFYDPDAAAVTGAEVLITVDESATYILTEANSGLTGEYQADAGAPVVLPGAQYDLFVAHDGDTVTATTVCADAIEIVETNIVPNDPMAPDTFEYGNRVNGDVENPTIRYTTSDLNRGYAFLLENMEPDWHEEYREVGEDNGPCDGSVNAWILVDLDELEVPNIILCATGMHRFRVISCDQALFDYFQTTFLGDPENYPTSNLSNGHGVFWAADADTAWFYLTDDIED